MKPASILLVSPIDPATRAGLAIAFTN